MVGAGISQPYGIPNWESLANKIWQRSFPDQVLPWDSSSKDRTQALSQFLPMIFELAYRKLGVEEFAKQLRNCMYENAPELSKSELKTSSRSLAVLARTIVQEFRAAEKRRIIRVLTLNADELLERAIELLGRSDERIIDRIRTPLDQPSVGGAKQPIPVYHLHGCIPHTWVTRLAPQLLRTYDHMLVFSDAQYWASASSILSFANRIMGAALHDSHCIFVGLSMTDLNILRWLALRHVEFDKAEEQTMRAVAMEASDIKESLLGKAVTWLHSTSVRRKLRRHFWIRPSSDDPTGFLSRFLDIRGVRSVEIAGWDGDAFRKLMKRCFPPPRARKSGGGAGS